MSLVMLTAKKTKMPVELIVIIIITNIILPKFATMQKSVKN